MKVKPLQVDLASLIDYTLLKPEATKADIEKLCREALTHRFKTVCVNPTHVSQAYSMLIGSDVGVDTVVGFPLGANKTVVKVFEALEAIKDGALEVDMVINVGAMKANEYEFVRFDINSVVEAVHRAKAGVLVKVIIETGYLTDEEKVKACKIVEAADADFVKTCTGFSSGRATVNDVRLMRETVGERIGVKASGGIRTRAEALSMVEAGASRLGTSAGVTIIEGE